MPDYPASLIKTLFALSGNTCAYRGCEVTLTDPSWKQVRADIAHIRGRRPGSPRYDGAMSDAARDDFPNLILLCPNCHRRIDSLNPDGHPVELLEEMKIQHESRTDDVVSLWASDDTLAVFARLAIVASGGRVIQDGSVTIQGEPATIVLSPGVPRPSVVSTPAEVANVTVSASDIGVDTESLSVRSVSKLEAILLDNDYVVVRNSTEADAFGVTVDPLVGGEAIDWVSIPPPRISAGQPWQAGFLRNRRGDNPPIEVRVHWRDESGVRYDADFSLPVRPS